MSEAPLWSMTHQVVVYSGASVISESAMSCLSLECTCGVSGVHELHARLRRMPDPRDPRDPRGRRYALSTVLLIALCALACGFDSYRAMGQWARGAPAETLLRLGCRPVGVFGWVAAPSAATVRRVVRMLPPGGLERLLRVLDRDRLRQVAVDGKVLRGSRSRQLPAVMVLAAMGDDAALLARQRVSDKTNEITGFTALLAALDLTEVVVAADALHTQREHAIALVEEFGAHYAFTVKRNQPELWAACKAVPWEEVRATYRSTTRGHGRIDTRVIEVVAWDDLNFPHVRQVARITRCRKETATGKRSKESVYVITGLSARQADPCRIGEIVRSHRGIENKIHHVRDTTFGEDASRIRTRHGAQNTATLRSVAMNFPRTTGTSIADARRQLALTPHRAPLDLFGCPAGLRHHP
jgi:predicted transposase YbfD/YdcC